MAITENPQKKCSFLDLPAELRNKTYELLLVDDIPLKVMLCDDLPHSTPALWQPATNHLRCDLPHLQQHSANCSTHRLAITATCQQIRNESFSLFLGSNAFKIHFGDRVPATNDPRLLQNFSRTRDLHLRAWLSYLGDFKSHLRKVEIQLGLHGDDFDAAWLIGTFKHIKATLPRTAVVTITADISIQSVQTVGTRAIPPLRITTGGVDLDDALLTLATSVQRKMNWVTSRGQTSALWYYAATWKHISVADLQRLGVKLERLLRDLDGGGAWRWNGVGAS